MDVGIYTYIYRACGMDIPGLSRSVWAVGCSDMDENMRTFWDSPECQGPSMMPCVQNSLV